MQELVETLGELALYVIGVILLIEGVTAVLVLIGWISRRRPRKN